MAKAKKEGEEAKKEKRPTPAKRMLQNQKRRVRNRDRKSQIRTAIRAFETALEKGAPEDVKAKLSKIYSLVDRAVKTGVYKRNKASRTKSRLKAKVAA